MGGGAEREREGEEERKEVMAIKVIACQDIGAYEGIEWREEGGVDTVIII